MKLIVWPTTLKMKNELPEPKTKLHGKSRARNKVNSIDQPLTVPLNRQTHLEIMFGIHFNAQGNVMNVVFPDTGESTIKLVILVQQCKEKRIIKIISLFKMHCKIFKSMERVRSCIYSKSLVFIIRKKVKLLNGIRIIKILFTLLCKVVESVIYN